MLRVTNSPRAPMRLLTAALVCMAVITAIVASSAQACVYEGKPAKYAVKANTNALWLYETPESRCFSGVGLNTSLGIQPGSNPAIAGGGVAFVANGAHAGELWTYLPGYGGLPLGLGVEGNTSPATSAGGWGGGNNEIAPGVIDLFFAHGGFCGK